ncbi:Pyoverdine biosynthesis [Metarhizium album ARSEF 1941]|uniref:Pyoverdine biosynthesis n=1 Tax=Metarhizium album (strain ARSEF 1941) TaxID=1081103 RepID=A0A0B2WQY9_METAS|nr:Pyoverdine biosynthesis [Metarhizium album ARSEF 1941]KHN95912.1 Pyoverdine biosynthesis [Metarhizium album ARSEF 1941]
MPSAASPAYEANSAEADAKATHCSRGLSVDDFPHSIGSSALDTASRILGVIDRYRLEKPKNGPPLQADQGALKFLAIIYSHVKAGRVIPMCLPAFPFKSPNTSAKVLGKNPDKAEELALSHLNGLCQAIADIYPPGAKLTLISDGLVYNDLLGVPDKDVWSYGENLRLLAKSKGFTQIEFCRLRHLVSIYLPEELDEMTYVANASNFRRELLNAFGNPNWKWKEVRQLEDVSLTYRGYIKFLETDLATVYPLRSDRTKSKYKRGIEYIARQMMYRGDAFASAVRQKYKNHVRLSIHRSTGANKLSISLLPTTTIFTTPWHSTVGYKLDGTVVSGMRSDFYDDETYELVLEKGIPSYYREESHLFSWGAEKGGVTFEPIYPSGWLLKPAAGPGSMTIEDIDAAKVRSLSEINSPVVMRGFFKSPKQAAFVKKSNEFGEPKCGLVLEAKDQVPHTRGLNNGLSAEWMPFHYDGLSKTLSHVHDPRKESRVSAPPRYLPKWLTVEELATKTWTVSTSSIDTTKLSGLPLVSKHPTTGKPCLRYHEAWSQSKTQFDATLVTLDGHGETSNRAIREAISTTLNDRRVAYWHTWEKGDLIVSDNTLMMHTRSDFSSGSDGELWRIHLD